MHSSGVIYSYQRIRRLRALSKGLIFFSLFILLYLFFPIGITEFRYATAETHPHNPVEDEAAAHGLSSYFSLFIPKLDARANITANVPLTNFADALAHGIAHAEGTNFPGQGKTIYLFAHSTDSPFNFTRYNAVFYLLHKLTPVDRIVVYFLDQKYIYEVQSLAVVSSDDVSWLSRDFGTEVLILQTCDPPGTTLRRLLVIATRVV